MKNQFKDVIWVAKSLFNRGLVSGSSANLSIKVGDEIFITATGSCFGNLEEDSFSRIANGEVVDLIKPSKELPLHEALYESNEDIKAVIHTHSTFATFWSCVLDGNNVEIPTPTPYLGMKVGELGWVDYEKPGSPELFAAFRASVNSEKSAYLMKNHGVIVGADNIMEAFYKLEEIEEASKNAWLLETFNK